MLMDETRIPGTVQFSSHEDIQTVSFIDLILHIIPCLQRLRLSVLKKLKLSLECSGLAMGGQGDRVPSLTAKNLPKIGGKKGKNQKKVGKIGKKRNNREGSFTLPLLTDRAGYATAGMIQFTLLNMLKRKTKC